MMDAMSLKNPSCHQVEHQNNPSRERRRRSSGMRCPAMSSHPMRLYSSLIESRNQCRQKHQRQWRRHHQRVKS